MAANKPRKSTRVILGGQEDDSIRQITQAENALVVTPSNTDTFPKASALFVGTGGNVAVRMIGGGEVTFNNVADGTFLPILVDQVKATGTTASDILRLF